MRNSDWVLLFLRRAHRPVQRDAAQTWREIFLQHARITEAEQRASLAESQVMDAQQEQVSYQQPAAHQDLRREQRQPGQRGPEDD